MTFHAISSDWLRALPSTSPDDIRQKLRDTSRVASLQVAAASEAAAACTAVVGVTSTAFIAPASAAAVAIAAFPL